MLRHERQERVPPSRVVSVGSTFYYTEHRRGKKDMHSKSHLFLIVMLLLLAELWFE